MQSQLLPTFEPVSVRKMSHDIVVNTRNEKIRAAAAALGSSRVSTDS